MKTSTLILAGGCIGLLALPPVIFSQSRPFDAVEELRAVVTQMVSEVSSLKAEILRLQIESAEALLQKSEHEWNDARQEQQRLDEEYRGLVQEVQELDTQLLQPNLSPETRADTVQAKLDAQTSGTASFRAERALADRRESITRIAYEQAHKAHSQLVDRAAALSHKAH